MRSDSIFMYVIDSTKLKAYSADYIGNKVEENRSIPVKS